MNKIVSYNRGRGSAPTAPGGRCPPSAFQPQGAAVPDKAAALEESLDIKRQAEKGGVDGGTVKAEPSLELSAQKAAGQEVEVGAFHERRASGQEKSPGADISRYAGQVGEDRG